MRKSYLKNALLQKQHSLWLIVICLHLSLASADYSVLTYDEIMTPEHKAWESVPQYQKDRELMNALCSSKPYAEQRKHIAAAVHAGANVPTVQLRTSSGVAFKLMPLAVMMQDLPLITLLLAKHADIDERGYNNFSPIYFATTVTVAKPLIDKGAMDILTTYEKKELLFRSLRAEFEPALIALYKQYYPNSIHPDLIIFDSVYNSALMRLVAHADQNMVKKTKALFDGLSPKVIYTYITNTNYYRQNVFDIIATEHQKSDPHARQNLQDLEAFLRNKLNNICILCKTPFDTTACSSLKGTRLHVTCLVGSQQNSISSHAK